MPRQEAGQPAIERALTRPTKRRKAPELRQGTVFVGIDCGWYEFELPALVPAELMTRALGRLSTVIARRKQALSEENIESLVDILLHYAVPEEVELDLEFDNAQLRTAYLQTTRMFTSAEIRKISGLTPKNQSEPASRWSREKKLFCVRHKGKGLFPAFQFEDGAPNPLIKQMLDTLPADFSAWQIAFWFASGNGWLNGAAPQDRLDIPGDLIAAAKQAAHPAPG